MDGAQILGILSDTYGLLSAVVSFAKALHGSNLAQRNIDCLQYAVKNTAKKMGWNHSSAKMVLPLENIEDFQLSDHFREELARLYQKNVSDITEMVIRVWFDFYLRKVIEFPELARYLHLHQGAEAINMLRRLSEENRAWLAKMSPSGQNESTVTIKVGKNSKGGRIAGGSIRSKGMDDAGIVQGQRRDVHIEVAGDNEGDIAGGDLYGEKRDI